MLSRHFLRSKVLQLVYSIHIDPVDVVVAEKNFKHNIERFSDLGNIQIAALVHFVEVSAAVIDEAQHKYLPTEADLNPNRRLPNNLFIQRLADNYDYRHHCKDSNVNWGGVEWDEVFRQAYAGFVKSPDYVQYLNSEQDFATDQQFALKLFKYLMNFEPLRDRLYG